MEVVHEPCSASISDRQILLKFYCLAVRAIGETPKIDRGVRCTEDEKRGETRANDNMDTLFVEGFSCVNEEQVYNFRQVTPQGA